MTLVFKASHVHYVANLRVFSVLQCTYSDMNYGYILVTIN